MSSPLTQSRVIFDGGVDTSNPIDLSGYVLRGVFSPAGHALGKIGMTVKLYPTDDDDAVVPIDLADTDEAPTLLRLADDWPLCYTTFHVEHPHDDVLTLFLVVEHRG